MDETIRALFLGAGTLMMVVGGSLMDKGDVTGLLWFVAAFGVYWLRGFANELYKED